MTPSIPDGGFSDPALPATPVPSPGAGAAPAPPLTDKLQVVHFLAGTALHVPNFANLKMAHMKPMHKTLQHDVVKELISKFKPVLTELAVLALRGQQAQPRIEKPPAATPSESGTRRDEAAPKGGTTLGKDLVNIEVHSSEESRNEPNPHSQPSEKSAEAQTPAVNSGKEGETQEAAALPLPAAASSKEVPSLTTAPSAKENAQKNDKPGDAPSEPLKKEESGSAARHTPSPTASKGPKETANAGGNEAANDPLKHASAQKASTASAQTANAKIAQEAHVKPLDAQPKEPSSNAAPHKTNPTKENVPDQAVGIKEVPKNQETPTNQAKEIPQDLAHKAKMESESNPLQTKHEESAVFAALLTRTLPEEPTPTAQHKMFPVVDNNGKAFVPPWLGLLLPDLIKAKTARDSKGGKQQGGQQQKPHKLTDILFMLLCAHLAGASSLADIFNFIQTREKWFSVVLGFKHGLPPRQLIFWLLTTLDPRFFDRTVRRWLEEVIGNNQRAPRLLEIFICQTHLGYLLGETRRPGGNFKTEELVSFAEGFAWNKSVLLIKADCTYGSLFAKIRHQGGHYLAEAEQELLPPEEHDEYESYLEGQERILLQTWRRAGRTETEMKVLCEIIDSQGGISRSERYLTSSLENPAGYFFDLFRLQRAEEAKCAWLLNVALSLPSMAEALESCAATLNHFREFAIEMIAAKCNSSDLAAIQSHMEKAAASNDYLLTLFTAKGIKK